MMNSKYAQLSILIGLMTLGFLLAGFRISNSAYPFSSFRVNEKGTGLSVGIELPEEVNETSGLLYVNGLLLTHNDHGGKPALYVFDTLGKIVNKISVRGASNDDWEDLAQNEKFIFIGNFGNNDGDRRNLQIIKIAKSGLDLRKSTHVRPDETITFIYPDQEDFNPGKSHNFDCEAFICLNEKLYLFTKNGKSTTVYQLSISGKNQTAKKLGNFDTPGRITGADISADGSKICLTGYLKKDNCFLVFLENFKTPKFFSGQKTEVDLGDYFKVGQLEGVGFKSNSSLFLTAEKTKKNKAQLYRFSR